MEILGYNAALSNLKANGIVVDVLVTDQHAGIMKAAEKDDDIKEHTFDYFHMRKSKCLASRVFYLVKIDSAVNCQGSCLFTALNCGSAEKTSAVTTLMFC